jgi:hypothetical protein
MEHGARFIGGEPDESAVARAVLARGYAKEDLLGFYFVRQLLTLRRDGTLAEKGLDECFRSSNAALSRAAGLEDEGARFTLDRFHEWYARRQGKPFDAAMVDNEEPAPIATGKYFTQRISSVVGLVRDRFIVQLIASYLATDKGVLVVYGASHFPTQEPALKMLLGEPRFSRAL